jgi:outer membrane protein assembly factor BamB
VKCSSSRSRLVVCLGLLVLACPAAADNWPQWRGPTNDGISKEKGLPIKWSADENIAWKLPLPGMGGSTPAIWGDRIFLTSEDGTDLVLLCVSTGGKEIWQRKLGTGGRKVRGDEGNDASPSPSTDGKHVFAYDGQGDLVCFDFAGKEVWRFNTQDRYGKISTWHGWHTTPVLHGDRLYLQLIHSGGASVVAIDKNTGKEAWKVERKSDGRRENEHSYASPSIWQNGKQAYLITHGADYAIAHSLEDGSEIWRLGDLNPKDSYNEYLRFVASPVATPDLIVVPSAKNGPVVGVKPDARGFVKTGSPGERWRRPHGTPDVPSPLVVGGLVYLCREGGGVLICLDAKTGKEEYTYKELHRARYRASPVYADGNIYLTARDGTVTVVKAGPKFEKLAVNRLPDQTSASPAISGGRIYIRGFKALYAIGAEKK